MWRERKTPFSYERYSCSQDKVFQALSDILEQERLKNHKFYKIPVPSIQFIREGEQLNSSKETKKSLLQEA